MNSARLKAMITVLLVICSATTAEVLRPDVRLADSAGRKPLAELFPAVVGEWRIDDRQPVQLVAPDQQATLDRIYSETVSRNYVNGHGERVMLSVAYGGDQSDATRAHRPDVCYPAQGFQLRSRQDTIISVGGHSLPVRRLVAQQGGRIEPISYWVVVGDRIARSGTEHKLAQLSYGLNGVIPDGMLVRVSTISADAQSAYAVHKRFLDALYAGVAVESRSRVFGAGG